MDLFCIHVVLGVPRSRRGDIWQLLVEHQLSNKGKLNNNVWLSDEYGILYDDLLKQLTTHQHAILIDLGKHFFCRNFTLMHQSV